MSIIGSNVLAGASGSGVSAYEIEQSLRFDGSSHLNRTPSSAGTTTTWTFSCWLKLAGTSEGCPLSAAESGGYTALFHSVGGEAHFRLSRYVGSNQYAKSTTSRYRDPSAWYHLITVFDSTNSTAADRIRYYVNGVRLTDFSNDGSSVTNVDPGLNAVSAINSNTAQRIGSQFDGTYAFLKGYMAEAHMLDGTAVTDAEDFGEYDENGVWRPIEVSGVTYGTNGYYLKFDPSATNGIGHDHSGNGNNFTADGFTTSGTGTDVMSDAPTNNFCTWNPLGFRNDNVGKVPLYYEGNLKARLNQPSTGQQSVGTIQAESGHYYVEFTIDDDGPTYSRVGVAANSQKLQAQYTYYRNGTSNLNGTLDSSYGATWTTGDIIGCRFDLDEGEVEFYKNGTSQGALSVTFVTTYGSHYGPFVGGDNNTQVTLNAGQRAFSYTMPTGASTLCTSNLPAPEIEDGSEYFNTVLWTGDGSLPRSITGVGFQPDWVWMKNRDSAARHQTYDAVRGTGTGGGVLYTDVTDAVDDTYKLDSFDSDGFTLGTNLDNVNSSGDGIVGWNWLAGGSTSSNTNGSITSTVSVNATAGFSIVGYTGTTAAATVGHGLGVAPSLVLVKIRSQAGNWQGYHASLGKDYTIKLNTTDAQENISDYWGSGGVTSTVVGLIGGGYGINVNGATHIAYCFAEVEGYSKFGNYTGNGNADGPFVFCGFKPAWILTKSSTLSGTDSNWRITDTARSTYNVSDDLVWANLNNVELANANGFDICSNGFKIRTASNEVNKSGETYIFAAFAENPFGGDGVSPATAR